VALSHQKVSAKADGGDSTLVLPSDWNAEHITDANGAKMLGTNTDPAAAAATYATFFAQLRSGRALPAMRGERGFAAPMQPAYFNRRISRWFPSSGTTLGAENLPATTAATLSHPTVANTALINSISRVRFATSTTIGNSANARASVTNVMRGNATAAGGFYFYARFTSGNIAAGSLSGRQVFVGLSSTNTALGGDPSTNRNDVLGVGTDSADTNWQFMRRTGAGAASKVSLGLAPANDQVFDMIMYTPPGSAETTVYVYVVTYDNAGAATIRLNTSYNTALPASGTLLCPQVQIRTTTGVAQHVELAHLYVESEF